MSRHELITRTPKALKQLAGGLSVVNKAAACFDISGTIMTGIYCVAVTCLLLAWGIETANRRGWIR